MSADITRVADEAAADLAELAVDLLATDEKRAGQLLDIATALRQATAVGPALHIIRRADGEDMHVDYKFFVADGPEDWTVPEETHPAHEDPAEYQILACRVVNTRTFGVTEDDEDESVEATV